MLGKNIDGFTGFKLTILTMGSGGNICDAL